MAAGIFNSASYTADLAKKSFGAAITRLMPQGTCLLYGLTSMLGEEKAVATEHGFFTKTMVFPSVVTSVAANSTDTTITVVSTTNIVPGAVLRVESTKEILVVNSVISGTQLQVARGVGTVAAAAIGNTASIYQIGSAYEESSIRPQAKSIPPVRITNYTQIFRNTWGVSGSAAETEVIAGDSTVAENKEDCAAFHATDIETALFFEQKLNTIRNNQPFRKMDGLFNIIGTLSYYPPSYGAVNVFAAGGTTNWTQLEGFLDPTLNQQTDPKTAKERTVFCGATAMKVINNIGRMNSQYQVNQNETEWGLRFSTFNTTRGTFHLIEHPLFNSNADWAKMAAVVDLSSIRVANLGNRKTQYKAFNAKGEECAVDNGIDAQGGTLTSELTLIVKNPPANALITNLTAAAVG